MPPLVHGVHHVQLGCPARSEPRLREFYCGVLGMTEVQKPPVLAARGGAWFRAAGVELHFGVENPFRAARKAHPGLLVADLDACAQRLRESGCDVKPDQDLPGFRRLYTADPVGNRLELLQPR